MARWNVRAYLKGLWDRRKQGVTALLSVLAGIPELMGRKFVVTLASKLMDHLVAVLPELFQEHGFERLLFLTQVVGALVVIHALRKALSGAKAQLVVLYMLSLIGFYIWPTLTSGSPVPIGGVTGNALREAAFGVMSCCLLQYMRLLGKIPNRAADLGLGALFVLQVLAVTGGVDPIVMNVAFTAFGTVTACVFAYAVRDQISKPSFWLLQGYSYSLILRPLVSGLFDLHIPGLTTDILTRYYYLAMLGKLPALIEIAISLARAGSGGNPPEPPRNDWPLHFETQVALFVVVITSYATLT